MKQFIFYYLVLNSVLTYSQTQRLSHLNLDRFSHREKNFSAKFSKLFSAEFLNHPELGLKPFNSPACDNCIEVIDRRNANSRFFIDVSNENIFYQQTAYSPIHYKDENGYWREINSRLSPGGKNIFEAPAQPSPVRIDLTTQTVSIRNGNYSIRFLGPFLYVRDTNGIENELGKANVNDYQAGDDGIRIINYYPDVDLIYAVKAGEVETFFVLNKPLSKMGEVILKQPFILTDDIYFHSKHPEQWNFSEQFITDNGSLPLFKIGKGFAFDNNPSSGLMPLPSRVNDNKLEFIIPKNWLNNPSTTYPVVIDPVVTSLDSLAVASLLGTRYSPVCWTNSCDYFLTVPTPPNSTITEIRHSFEYYATGACYADDGGYSIEMGTCYAPASAPGVYTNSLHATNALTSQDTVIIPEFVPCFPAPTCAPQNLNFTLHFYRCNNDPDTSCSNNCILATKPWIMEIRGRTIELSYLTSAAQICEGASAQLVATPMYGVPPYSYSWTPGLSNTDTIVVTPAIPTQYTVTVTDACGNTASDTTTVNVTPNNNPGFTISPNPACTNSPVSILGNGTGLATAYDWQVTGSNQPGGVVSDTQTTSCNYTLPGIYDIILSYDNCAFKDTQQVTILNPQAATVSITAQPSTNICTGDTLTFQAFPVNGGTTPQYDWYIDNILVQSGNTDSLVTNILNNGSLVQAVLHSNATCASSLVDTASLFISVSNALVPQVNVSPDTMVCPGAPVTLTANPVNGGATPTFQWFANGVPVAGATASSYSFLFTPPDTLISVAINSSLSCVSIPFAADTALISTYQNVVAGVSISAFPNGSVCTGDSVVFTAHPSFGGINPQFDWYVNGILTSNTDSVFTVFPVANDSISVQMTSDISCASVAVASGFILASVTPAVSPVVSLSANPSATVCQGDTATFIAQALNAGSSPVYSWTINGIPAGTNDSTLTLSSINNNDVIRIIVNSSLNCAPVPSDTDQVTMSVIGNVTPAVTITSSGSSLCEGSPIQFIANATNAGTSPAFQWLVNGVSTGLLSDTIILTNLSNEDTLQVNMTSSINCTSSGIVSATLITSLQPRVMPQISVTAQPTDSVCLGQSVTLQAQVLNGGSSPIINWYVNGILYADSNTTFRNDSFVSGDVIVANLISNAPCLLQPDDTSNFIRIVYRTPLNVTITSASLACAGVPAVLTAHPSGGNGGPYHYFWNNGSADTSSIIVVPDKNTHVMVRVEDNCTASPATNSIHVQILPTPQTGFLYHNPLEGSFLNTIQFTNISTDVDSWLWYITDSITTSTVWNPIHVFPGPGIYPVRLYTYNNSGCLDSVIYNVYVREDIALFYPNSFTPNADGNNDYFLPLGSSVDAYEMTIWNRWGELIYEGNSLSGWNGTVKKSASLAPEGVYVFRLNLKLQNYPDKIVTGKVTLIR